MNPENYNQSQMSEIFSLAQEDEETPYDFLVAKLLADGGEAWLERALQSEPFTELSPVPQEWTSEKGPDLDSLNRLRRDGKSAFTQGKSRDEQARGGLAYVFSLAAGLVYHQQLISSLDPNSIRDLLSDLRPAFPTPWQAWLAQALEGIPAPDAGDS